MTLTGRDKFFCVEVENLKEKTFKGLTWSFAENFSVKVFGFIQGVILARLLMPSDFGLIAELGVFNAVAAVFIDSGFANALIRKKSRTAIDYSTVYVTNVVLAIVVGGILCICAKPIASFYNEPLLNKIITINALILVMNSFIALQNVRLIVSLDFKTKSVITVISTVITGLLTILMAFMGFGVWSLIYPNFLTIFIQACLFWRLQHWFPGIRFSWSVWKEHFSYGSKLLLSSLLGVVYDNIYPLVIGKKFSATDLGYYSRAYSYPNVPSATISSVITSVSFPVLAKVQDDDEALEAVYRRLIKLSAYLIFPVMLGMAALANPFIIALITEKWSSCVVYLRIICLALMWVPIQALNQNLLQVKGRSDLFLRVEVIKKTLGVSVLIITLPFGIIYMCAGQVCSSIIGLLINTYYTGKMIRLGFVKQMKDIFPSFLYALSMALLVWLCVKPISNVWLQLIIGIPIGIVYYVGISLLTKSSELTYVIRLVKDYILKK